MHHSPTTLQRRRGFTMVDLTLVVAVACLALALAVPVLSQVRGTSDVDVSLNNLAVLGLAHSLYAADWEGRQYTNVVDEFSIYGNSPAQAAFNYMVATGDDHPPILVGWGFNNSGTGGLWGYYMQSSGNTSLLPPLDFETISGNFRLPNSKGFHEYVSGRYYDDRFWAPADTLPYAAVEPFFADPQEFVPVDPIVWSSYCNSPAAMFDPGVLRAPSSGGFQDPFSFPTAFTSPALSAAAYPDLKTHMMEHHWVQNPPGECNPFFGDQGTFDGCEPYYFNSGIDSEPATLFYDGHVRLLPNTEVQSADQTILEQSGGTDGLWSRDTPLGINGYFLQASFDDVVDVSHHVLTTDGILGRDTLGPTGTPNVLSGPDRRFSGQRLSRQRNKHRWPTLEIGVTP